MGWAQAVSHFNLVLEILVISISFFFFGMLYVLWY